MFLSKRKKAGANFDLDYSLKYYKIFNQIVYNRWVPMNIASVTMLSFSNINSTKQVRIFFIKKY